MFLDRARRLLSDWDAALEAAQAERKAIAGRIRVIAPVAVGQSLLARIASRFLLTHPDVTFQWELRNGPVDMIAANCDLWIQVGPAPRDDLVSRRIYDIRRAIVASPKWPQASHPRDFIARPAVHLTSFVPSAVRLTRGNDVFVLRHNAVFGTDNLHAAHVAALEGVGYAILPLWLVMNDVRSGALSVLCPEWNPPGLQLSLAYHSAGRPGRVRALVDFMEAELTSEKGLGVTYLKGIDAVDVVTTAASR
jgi:DNA-binding transcriptional LysR family regulator